MRFTAQTGQRDALVTHLLRAAALVRDLDGCHLYVINTTPDDADTVWVTEIWGSEADQQASLALESVREAIGEVMPLLAGPPDRIELEPVGGVGLAFDSGDDE